MGLAFILLLGCNGSSGTNVPLVGDLLKHFDDLAHTTMNQGTKDLDYLSVKTGDQLEVMVKNLMIQFDGRYDMALRDLNQEEQKLFGELNTTEKLISQGMTTVKRTEELANLDLIQFTNKFKLLGKSTWFYISSINGHAIGQQEQQHNLEIVDLGFGYSNVADRHCISPR